MCRGLKSCSACLLDTSNLLRFKKQTEILICFLGIRECVFGTSFLLTLDIYKAYFRGRHIREYKENICKRWPMPYSFKKKLLRLCALGFCNQVLLDLHCWWSEKLCSQQSSLSWWVSHVLGFVQQKGWHSYIEKFRSSEEVEGFCCEFIYEDCRVYGQRFCTRSETFYYSGLLFVKIFSQVFYCETSLFH